MSISPDDWEISDEALEDWEDDDWELELKELENFLGPDDDPDSEKKPRIV